MTSARATVSLAALLLLTSACAADPPSEPADQGKQGNQAEPAEAAPPPAAKPADPNELTPEELELIDADPKTLTPEQNRKRAFALRKKVMKNPDSAAAQALEEARQAALSGEGKPPGAPEDNGVVIPAPEHLKNQDQSYGEPAL